MGHLAGVLAFALSLFGLVTVVEAARTPGLPPGFKVPTVYPAKLHVAGGLTITSKENSLSKCAPGQAWTMIEKVDFVINDKVTVQNVSGKIASSTFAREPGAVDQVSSIRDYRTTNYCPPTAPAKLVKPKCSTTGGTGVASLTADPRLNGEIGIGITRHGSSRQDATCLGPALDPSPRGTVLNALQMPFMGIALPLELTTKRLKNLKRGKSLISRVEIGGRCAFSIADPNPALDKTASDDDCEVEGFVNVQIKRLRKR